MINIRKYFETTQWWSHIFQLFVHTTIPLFVHFVSYHISNQNDNVRTVIMYQIINISKYFETTQWSNKHQDIYIETTQWWSHIFQLFVHTTIVLCVYCVSHHISNQNDNAQTVIMYQIINIRKYIETTQWSRFFFLYTQRSCFFIYCVSYHISNQNDNVQIKMIAYQINIRKYIETTLLFVRAGHAFYLLCFISCIKKTSENMLKQHWYLFTLVMHFIYCASYRASKKW